MFRNSLAMESGSVGASNEGDLFSPRNFYLHINMMFISVFEENQYQTFCVGIFFF